MELEKLLNKLIEKGREPFGNYRDIITRYKYDERFFEFNHEGDNMVSLRELVSKESFLRQFVCKNGMVVRKRQGTNWLGGEPEKCFDYKDYEYRIIESALCNEDKLEQYLLDNIKL